MKKEFKYLKKHKALTESKKVEKINEEVLVVNDGELFKVNKVIDVPKKLINAVVKKAKEETGKDPKIFWNDVAIAEEIVKYIIANHLEADSLPGSILMGDTSLATSGMEGSDDDLEDTGLEDEGAEGGEDDLEDTTEGGEEDDVDLPDDLNLDDEDDSAGSEEASEEDVPSLDDEDSEDTDSEDIDEE